MNTKNYQIINYEKKCINNLEVDTYKCRYISDLILNKVNFKRIIFKHYVFYLNYFIKYRIIPPLNIWQCNPWWLLSFSLRQFYCHVCTIV